MTVLCNEANGCLMMHQGRTCLLLVEWWKCELTAVYTS